MTTLSTSMRVRLLMAFAAVYLIWGSTYLMIRFAIESLPLFTMAGVRFLIAGAVLYGFARLRGAAPPLREHWRSAAIVGGFLLLGGNGGVVWAEQYVPSGLTALLVATEPLWIVVLLWVGRERVRPTLGLAVGLVFGFAGVAVLVGPGGHSAGEPVHPIGALVVVMAACSWAYGSLRSRHLSVPSSPQVLAGMQMMAGGAMLTLAGVASGEVGAFDASAVTARSRGAFVYLVVVGSLVGFTAYSWLVRNAQPSRVATYAFVNPVVAVVLGWAFAGEPITPRTLVAAAVIVAGVVVIILQRSAPPAPDEPPETTALSDSEPPRIEPSFDPEPAFDPELDPELELEPRAC